jgi:hypothetical protein
MALNVEDRDDLLPVCPHCKKDIDKIFARDLNKDIMGSRRVVYFCPNCRATLGVSHRKGFFLGL